MFRSDRGLCLRSLGPLASSASMTPSLRRRASSWRNMVGQQGRTWAPRPSQSLWELSSESLKQKTLRLCFRGCSARPGEDTTSQGQQTHEPTAEGLTEDPRAASVSSLSPGGAVGPQAACCTQGSTVVGASLGVEVPLPKLSVEGSRPSCRVIASQVNTQARRDQLTSAPASLRSSRSTPKH